MKKILFMLATQKGFEVLKYVSVAHTDKIGAVISFDEVGVEKNWCNDIAVVCERKSWPFHKWKDVKNDLTFLIRKYRITGIICISWRYLLPTFLNDILQDDIVVLHDSLLPKYRGFAPIVTAMICGEKTVGATALYAADEVDAGDMICQKSFEISKEDYIADVMNRMSKAYCEIVDYVLRGMIEGNLPRIKQEGEAATYSLWRNEEDYWIDWSESAEYVSRFIHAVGYPYKGALTYDGKDRLRVVRSSEVAREFNFPIRDTGKIWTIDHNTAVVVCGTGMIRIEEAHREDGSMYVFNRLRIRLGRFGGVFHRYNLLYYRSPSALFMCREEMKCA